MNADLILGVRQVRKGRTKVLQVMLYHAERRKRDGRRVWRRKKELAWTERKCDVAALLLRVAATYDCAIDRTVRHGDLAPVSPLEALSYAHDEQMLDVSVT
jgi:hypothetical protein